MRIAVADILGWLAAGVSPDDMLADDPELTARDIRAALSDAADRERQVAVGRVGMRLLFDRNLSFRLALRGRDFTAIPGQGRSGGEGDPAAARDPGSPSRPLRGRRE